MSTAGTALGRFAVGATPAEAEAFRDATGARSKRGNDGGTDMLPATFPIRWLVSPEVRAALVRVVDDPALLLVHESQSFAYTAPLHVERPYWLALSGRRQADPARLVVDGVVSDEGGTEVARLETVLRLIAAFHESAA